MPVVVTKIRSYICADCPEQHTNGIYTISLRFMQRLWVTRGQFWCKILGLVAVKKDASVSTCKVGDCIPCTSWSIYINQLSFIFIPTIKDKTTMSVSPKCHHSPGSSPGILLIPVAGYVAPAQPLNNKCWQLELERRFSQTSNSPN